METKYILIISVIAIPVLIYLTVLFILGMRSLHMKVAYHRLRIGMPRSELISLFGTPSAIGSREDGAEILKWTLNERLTHIVFDRDTSRSVAAVIQKDVVIAFDGHNINKRIWF